MTTDTEKSALFWAIYELMVSQSVDGPVAELVEAAFEGENQLALTLDSTSSGHSPTTTPAQQRPHPVRTWLTGLSVSGFRGIGKEVSISLPPGPGLTIITGRNGSGKSSLADALEVVLTGDAGRLSGRTVDWRQSWRNIHDSSSCVIKAAFAVEGSDTVQIVRKWPTGDVDVAGGTTQVSRGGRSLGGLEQLGWKDALAAYRPMLAYSDLGQLILGGPTKFYDSLRSVLGLEEVSGALDALAKARLSREKLLKDAKTSLEPILAKLAPMEDPRAVRCFAALQKKWDLDEVLTVLHGDIRNNDNINLGRLQQLQLPAENEFENRTAALRSALQTTIDQVGRQETLQKSTAELLEKALGWHKEHGDSSCPVCATGQLDQAWAATAGQRVADLHTATAVAKQAEQALQTAIRDVRNTLGRPSELLRTSVVPGAAELHRLWSELAAGCEAKEPTTILQYSERSGELLAAFATFKTNLEGMIDESENRWRPVAELLAPWCAKAKEARQRSECLKRLREAETWLKGAEEGIRHERFQPIAARSQSIWAMLRRESNVNLASVTLEGSGNRRRVDLAVNVDGTEGGGALAVMSQGEINALALSLFIPRMTHTDSPFRFMVIDDPVQAMDPYKVDGLAQVLQATAKTHQVIVFTHDTRLIEAVRGLKIPATSLEANLKGKSLVDVRPQFEPVTGYIEDARALANASEEVGKPVVSRVVPGLCRSALEAQLTMAYRSSRLSEGSRHEDVEEALRGAKSLVELAALVFSGDARKGGDVYPTLNKRLGSEAADTFKLVNRGSHEEIQVNPHHVIEQTHKLLILFRKEFRT